MRKNLFINKNVLERAKALSDPLIQALLNPENKLAKRSHLHTVVLNPEFNFTDEHNPGNLPSEAILEEENYGDIKDWENDYLFFARAKALTSWRYKMATSKLKHTDVAILLCEGDAVMDGGVYEYGLAIGTSGIEGYKDEMVSYTKMNCIIAFAVEMKESYFSQQGASPVLEFQSKNL